MSSLAIVVRADNKYRIGAAALLVFLSLYALTNWLSLGTPAELPPIWINEHIPLLPITVWIYASYLLLLLAAFILEKDCIQLTRFVYAQGAVNLTCAIFFVLWPTTFVRPELTGPDSISADVLGLVWFLDEPVNCFPSLHVSSVMVSVLMLWRSRHPALPLFALWALAISLSTLTTKQHHVADVIAGVLVAIGAYWLFFVHKYGTRTMTAQDTAGCAS